MPKKGVKYRKGTGKKKTKAAGGGATMPTQRIRAAGQGIGGSIGGRLRAGLGKKKVSGNATTSSTMGARTRMKMKKKGGRRKY